MSDRKTTTRTFTEAIARQTRATALADGDAVLVGNRAGVVEWTGEAWPRLTGFPLEETLDKPITHFLAQAGLEVELVDFVAQHFLEGRSCTIALPFDTFDGRTLDVELEVEPLRDEDGEISRFVAVAREVDYASRPTEAAPKSAKSAKDLPPPAHSRTGPADIPKQTVSPQFETPNISTEAPSADITCSIREVVRGALERSSSQLANGLGFESLAEKNFTDTVEMNPATLGAILDALIAQACRDQNHFVTIVAGRLDAGRSHHSTVHPVPQRAVASRKQPGIYLEVHDSGAHYLLADLNELRAGAALSNSALGDWNRAQQLARTARCSLHFESTPGCGNQALLVLTAPNT